MSRLPSGYTELEYIESSGTQYINTGLKNTAGDSYEIEFAPLVINDTQRYFGGLATSTGIGLGLRNDGNIMTFAGGWVYPSGAKPTINQKIKIEYRSGYGWYLDDILIDGDTSSATETQNNILVCSVMYNRQAYYPASIKLYRYKHTDSEGSILMELVPCKNSSNAVGMYDLVSESFFGNDGTGEFIGGRPISQKIVYNKVASLVSSSRLPSAYQEVEYLESSGEQYINTEVQATTSTGMDIDFAYTEISSDASAGVSGIYQGTNPRTDTFFISSISGKTNSYIELFHRGITYNTNVMPEALTKYNVKINWLNDGKANFNDSKITNVGSNQVIAKDIIIFGRLNNANNTYAFSKIRCYGVRFSEGSVVTMNLVPCYRKADNVAGMYDIVNNVFYTNAGTGTFEVGSNVGSSIIKHYKVASLVGLGRLPSAYQEVEYLESSGTQYIDTGKKYNTLNDKFEIDIGMYYAQAPADNEYVFGTPTATGRYLSPRIDKNKETITAVTGGSNASLWVNGKATPIGQKNDLKFVVNGKNLQFSVNGDLTSQTTSSTPSSTGTINLFDLGSSNNAFNGRIYYFTLLNQSNVKVIDLVPCYRKADNVAGMYDLVSGDFLTNDGTGTFAVGGNIGTPKEKYYKVAVLKD